MDFSSSPNRYRSHPTPSTVTSNSDADSPGRLIAPTGGASSMDESMMAHDGIEDPTDVEIGDEDDYYEDDEVQHQHQHHQQHNQYHHQYNHDNTHGYDEAQISAMVGFAAAASSPDIDSSNDNVDHNGTQYEHEEDIENEEEGDGDDASAADSLEEADDATVETRALELLDLDRPLGSEGIVADMHRSKSSGSGSGSGSGSSSQRHISSSSRKHSAAADLNNSSIEDPFSLSSLSSNMFSSSTFINNNNGNKRQNTMLLPVYDEKSTQGQNFAKMAQDQLRNRVNELEDQEWIDSITRDPTFRTAQATNARSPSHPLANLSYSRNRYALHSTFIHENNNNSNSNNNNKSSSSFPEALPFVYSSKPLGPYDQDDPINFGIWAHKRPADTPNFLQDIDKDDDNSNNNNKDSMQNRSLLGRRTSAAGTPRSTSNAPRTASIVRGVSRLDVGLS